MSNRSVTKLLAIGCLFTTALGAALQRNLYDYTTITFEDFQNRSKVGPNYNYLEWNNWQVMEPSADAALAPHGAKYAHAYSVKHPLHVGFVHHQEIMEYFCFYEDDESYLPEYDMQLESFYFGCTKKVCDEPGGTCTEVPTPCTIQVACLEGYPTDLTPQKFSYTPDSVVQASLSEAVLCSGYDYYYDCPYGSCQGFEIRVLGNRKANSTLPFTKLYMDDLNLLQVFGKSCPYMKK